MELGIALVHLAWCEFICCNHFSFLVLVGATRTSLRDAFANLAFE
ncbi:MAG: hypothetical protein V7K48_32150 [Nostoc sp.]